MADKKSLVNIDFGGSSSIKNLPSATAASGDYIVLTDTSDGGKAKKGPSFATNDGKFLRHDGSWIGALPLGGGTMAGHLKWADSSALPSATAAGLTGGLQFILGIKSFADGGDTVYETKANFLSGCVFYTAQNLSDAQKTQARDNIGAAAKKYRHNIVVEWYTGSGTSHYAGSLSFSFIDGSSQDYSTTGATYGATSFHLFLKDHCGMTDDKFTAMPMSGYATIGSTSLPETYFVTSIYNDHGSWYATGGYQANNSNNRVALNGAYDVFLPGTVSIVMYDHVEEC